VLGRWRDWKGKCGLKGNREKWDLGGARGGVRLKKPFPPPLPTRVSYLRMVLAPGGVSNSKLMYYLARKSEWWSANSI